MARRLLPAGPFVFLVADDLVISQRAVVARQLAQAIQTEDDRVVAPVDDLIPEAIRETPESVVFVLVLQLVVHAIFHFYPRNDFCHPFILLWLLARVVLLTFYLL